MATPDVNENCHYVQNDPHRCKIKLEKLHFDILWCYGVNYGIPPQVRQGWCITKLFRVWAIESSFGHIRHYTPIRLLLCCNDIKDWSILITKI